MPAYPDLRAEPTIELPAAGPHPVRVFSTEYNTLEGGRPPDERRYHIGFPQAMIEGLAGVLEQRRLWGQSWTEVDGLLIFSTPIVTIGKPTAQLSERLEDMLVAYNGALKLAKRLAGVA